MKLLMLAALATVAAPAFAQTMPAPGTMSDQQMSTPRSSKSAPDSMMAPPASPSPMSTPTASGDAMAADGAYPMCSRTVTDHCMERSNTRGERMHSTPRPRG